MNKIRQHRPAYMSGWDDEVVDFETTEQLLAIPFVKNFRDADPENFHQFSIGHGSLPALMAETHGGEKWWCIGFLDTADGIELPAWKTPYKLYSSLSQCEGESFFHARRTELEKAQQELWRAWRVIEDNYPLVGGLEWSISSGKLHIKVADDDVPEM